MEIIFYLTLCILSRYSLSSEVESEEEYDYEYDDAVSANLTKPGGGSRLIGAREGRSHEAPFVVVISRVSLQILRHNISYYIYFSGVLNSNQQTKNTFIHSFIFIP